jgi:pSer/pThr/pTyr-binding forkhead associated (FHA) protein
VSNHSLDRFLEACGASGPLEFGIESPDQPGSVPRILYQPFVLVGRDPRVSLILNHSDISRRHAYLQLIAGRMFCMDLQSRTGVHWEGGAKRTGWVDSGQAVRIGPYWIRPRPSVANPGATESEPGFGAAKQGLPQITLEFINRPDQASTWQMTPVLALVGKSPECRVHLVGQSVSSFHCSLVRTPLGLWVVDLIGRGGIWVNDLLVRSIRLKDGDNLRVGKFRMRIRYDSAPGYERPQVPAVSWGPLHREQTPAREIAVAPLNTPSPEIILAPTPVPPNAPAADLKQPPVPGHDLMLVSPDLPPVQADLAQALLVPMARQLGLMQQQMFDQFQQAMMMMFQMFNTLQRDQIGVIRQELDHLHKLTEELQTLQTELAKRTVATPGGARATPPQPVSPWGPPSNSVNTAGRTATVPKPAPVRPQPLPGGPMPVQAPPGSVPPNPNPESTATPAVAVPQPSNRPAAIPEHTDPAFHAFLAERIAAIQEERQTRWQKVVSFLSRK